MFASSSRLDVCLLLEPKNGAHMKTLMSTNSLIPIVIKYNTYGAVTAKDMGRLVSALRRPHRIRGIDLTLSSSELDKFFKATKCPFPALESLAIRSKDNLEPKIPATFLKGTNLHLRLRSLKLHPTTLTSISRLLSSALTDLSLKINPDYRQPPDLSLLLSQLQGLPNLRHLDLEIIRFKIDMEQLRLTEPKEGFRLGKLTSFRYRGDSASLDFLTMGFEAPSLQDVDICLYDRILTLSWISHLPQFINDVGEQYRAVRVVLGSDYFDFSLLAGLKRVGHNSPQFRLHLSRHQDSSIQNWIMDITSVFLAKLSIIEELLIIFRHTGDALEVIQWRTFLKLFPSVKEFRVQGTNNHRIASALHQEPNAIFPVLETITIYAESYLEPLSALAIFQQFTSARQQAGHPVKVSKVAWPWDVDLSLNIIRA